MMGATERILLPIEYNLILTIRDFRVTSGTGIIRRNPAKIFIKY